MIPYRVIERPAFRVAGQQTAISGPDNAEFGQFWDVCRERGLFETCHDLTGLRPGAQTARRPRRSVLLGVSRVEADPTNRAFAYLIGVELPADLHDSHPALEGLEIATVPAATWAVFDAHGPVPAASEPHAIVEAEVAAFGEWLPSSGYPHALAPEMEVYLPGEARCEFWLPVQR